MLMTKKRTVLVLLVSALSLFSCARPEQSPVHAPVEAVAPAKIVEPTSRRVEVVVPKKADEETLVPKTWLSREEVEAARGAEQQHARETQTFWAMRKDRESLRPTNLGPGGTCVCFGGDPLCSCR